MFPLTNNQSIAENILCDRNIRVDAPRLGVDSVLPCLIHTTVTR